MPTMRLLIVLLAVCFAGAAQAQFVWGVQGSACTPAGATVAAGKLRTNIASVQHVAGTTGQIVLNCQIEPFDSTAPNWKFELTYQDSTGAGTTASVRAQLYRMTIGTAAPAPLLVASSDSSAKTTLNTVFSPMLNHTFDFGDNIYWARVVLDRAATNETVIFHSLVLTVVLPSDIRLKHDIALLGHLENGLGFYRFSYNGSDKAYVGVMAQEVEAIMPDAVLRGSDGYLRVDYGRLGIRMQAWEDWVASGERIPATAASIRR